MPVYSSHQSDTAKQIIKYEHTTYSHVYVYYLFVNFQIYGVEDNTLINLLSW
jgi:hypothetical protein